VTYKKVCGLASPAKIEVVGMAGADWLRESALHVFLGDILNLEV